MLRFLFVFTHLFIRNPLHPSSKPDWCWDSSQWFVCSYEASGFSTRYFWSQGYLTRKASNILDWFLLNFIVLKLTFNSLDSQSCSSVKSFSEVNQSSHIELWNQCFNLAHYLLGYLTSKKTCDWGGLKLGSVNCDLPGSASISPHVKYFGLQNFNPGNFCLWNPQS